MKRCKEAVRNTPLLLEGAGCAPIAASDHASSHTPRPGRQSRSLRCLLPRRPLAGVAGVLVAAGLLVTGLAAQAQTQSVTWRLVVFDPDPARAPQAVQAVSQALDAFGRTAKSVGLLPSPLPQQPGSPSFKVFRMGPYSQRVMTCDDAYARIDNGSTAGNRLGGVSESYMGCVFPSAAGTRMVLTFERAKSGNSIGGAIVNMMAKTIQGTDEERARKVSGEVLASMRQVLPELLIESIELPGAAPERPDGAQVDRLLATAAGKPSSVPAAATMAAATTAAVPASESAPSDGAAVTTASPGATTVPAAVGAAASSAGVSSAPPAAPRATSMAMAIEARKNLAAMGLTYHSVDALHDAIRRKDRIAVQLFVEAAGVDLKAAGKDGLDAVALARQVGDLQVLELLERSLQP